MSTALPPSLRSMTLGPRGRRSSQAPPSPTFSDATNASAVNFGSNGPAKIITRANLKSSMQAHEDLVNTCASYRTALITMSMATAAFADAMEKCSSLKGPSYEAGSRLQAAAGLHHLIGNLWHVLASTLEETFERPLRHHLENYKSTINERSQAYEQSLRQKSQTIRDIEKRSMNKKQRNLQSFRDALGVLQRQVDELDELKRTHYEEIIEHEDEVWNVVQGKVCLVVRSSMDVFDRITSKASDPVIEPMLQSVPDPFDSYGPPQAEDQIFSILSPLSIMTNTHSSTPSPLAGTAPELDPGGSLSPSATSKITSWLPETNRTLYTTTSTDWPTESSLPVTPPQSASTPTSSGPGRGYSGTQRTNQNQVRPTLTAIGEILEGPNGHNATTASVSSNLKVITQTSDDWGFGQLREDEEGQLTPRRSNISISRSEPLPPEIAQATTFAVNHEPGDHQSIAT